MCEATNASGYRGSVGLLSLPRELRDKIYRYLLPDVVLRVPRQPGSVLDKYFQKRDLQRWQCPLILSNHQLHGELKDAFYRTVTLKVKSCSDDRLAFCGYKVLSGDPETISTIDVSSFRHLELEIKVNSYEGMFMFVEQEEDLWKTVEHLPPGLITLSLVLHISTYFDPRGNPIFGGPNLNDVVGFLCGSLRSIRRVQRLWCSAYWVRAQHDYNLPDSGTTQVSRALTSQEYAAIPALRSFDPGRNIDCQFHLDFLPKCETPVTLWNRYRNITGITSLKVGYNGVGISCDDPHALACQTLPCANIHTLEEGLMNSCLKSDLQGMLGLLHTIIETLESGKPHFGLDRRIQREISRKQGFISHLKALLNQTTKENGIRIPDSWSTVFFGLPETF